MIDPDSGLVWASNREADQLLGLEPGALVSFQNLVAGDGGDLLRALERIGAGRDRALRVPAPEPEVTRP